MSMARRTNQCLFNAKQALNESEGLSDSVVQRRLEEAALFHIYTAINSYMVEVCRHYALPPFASIESLFDQVQLPAELSELAVLSQDSASWLSACLKLYRKVLMEGLGDNRPADSLITSQSDFNALFRNWLIELEKLINRQRELYLEC